MNALFSGIKGAQTLPGGPHLKISSQKHKIDSLLLSSRCITNYMKSCSFLHAHFTLMKVVDYLLKTHLLLLKIRKKTIWKGPRTVLMKDCP